MLLVGTRKERARHSSSVISKKIMELEKKKYIIEIIMVIFVGISIYVSIRSCAISNNALTTAKNATTVSNKSNEIAKEANKFANDALESAQHQFIQVNRPYIIISPKKFDNGQFWEVSQKDKIDYTAKSLS